MKILVIKWGALGDFLAATPAIVSLKRHYKDAKIVLLSNGLAKEIFADSHYVDVIVERKEKSFFEMITFLRKQKFDMVVNLKWGSESADIFALLSGAKVSVGGSKSLFKHFYTQIPEKNSDYYHPNRHEYLKNLDIIQTLFPVDYSDVKGYIATKKTPQVSDFLQTNGLQKYIIISPAASTLKKAWKREKYIELSKKIIHDFNIKLVATYAHNDFTYTKEIVESIGTGAYMAPQTEIAELAYLVKNAILCICNNSGILHVAYMVETPVLCFNTSIGWHPFSKDDISIDRIPTDLEDNRSLSNERVEKLLDTIEVAEALQEVEKFLLTHEHL